jgi:hypothetical protein
MKKLAMRHLLWVGSAMLAGRSGVISETRFGLTHFLVPDSELATRVAAGDDAGILKFPAVLLVALEIELDPRPDKALPAVEPPH